MGAFLFAKRAHEGQARHGGQPYIEHPLAVAALLVEHYSAYHQHMILAALLHDVVEDTEVTLGEIRERYGSQVWKIVNWLTNPEQDEGESRTRYYKRVQTRWPQFSWGAKMVKLADRLHNLRSLPKSKWNKKQRAFYAQKSLELVEAFKFIEEVKLADLVRREALKWA